MKSFVIFHALAIYHFFYLFPTTESEVSVVNIPLLLWIHYLDKNTMYFILLSCLAYLIILELR